MNTLMQRALLMLLVLVPATIRAHTCEAWFPSGTEYRGSSNVVNAATLWDPDGSGPAASRLVIGGLIQVVGSVEANYVAMWNGSHWEAVGALPWGSAQVFALTTYNNQLIVAGSFASLGGVPGTSNIARWTGSAWQALSTGINGSVVSLFVHNGELIAGGTFTTAGGASANNIARWNGSTWQSMGSGMTVLSGVPSVAALTTFNGQLHAGGNFATAGGIAASNIARWTGSAWQALGTGMNNTVSALTVYNNQLIAGGAFTTAGGTSASRIASWTGSAWQSLGTGMNNTVSTLIVFNNQVIAAGTFGTAGGVTASRLARWNGTAWQSVVTNLASGDLHDLAVFRNELIVVGSFAFNSSSGSGTSQNVARWTAIDTLLRPLESTFSATSPTIDSTAIHDGELYIGGTFTALEGITLNNLARYDGAPWQPIGNGVSSIGALTSHNGSLVASVGPVVSRWDGSQWVPIGGQFSSVPWALAQFNGELIAAGLFTSVGGITCNRIARFDGSAWQPLGTGMNNAVLDLEVYNNELYAAGQFTTAGGVTVNRIARWNGTSWQDVGTGTTSGDVDALTVYNGKLIAVGSFNTMGGVTGTRAIASWNGSTWQTVGNTMTFVGAQRATVFGNQLVVAGGMGVFGSIARFDGGSWAALGTGLEGVVSIYELIAFNGELFVFGNFTKAGGQMSPYWARWGTSPAVPPGFSQMPEPQGVGAGSTLTLSAIAAPGAPGLRYQWYRNGIALINGRDGASPGGGTVTGGKGNVYSAARPIVLTIQGCQPSDAGLYTLRLISPCGHTTDSSAAMVAIIGADTCAFNCLP